MKYLPSSIKSQLLGAALFLGAASSALAGSLSETYGTSEGNSNLGTTANYNLSAANTATSSSVVGTATSSANLLGKSSPLETFSITSKVASGAKTNNVSLVIGSYIVYSATSSATATINKSVSQTFVTANSTVSVPTTAGAVPVAVSATLSGSGAINLTSTLNATANSVALSGTVGTDVVGTASAAVASTSKYKPTVVSNLQIGNAILSANAVSVTPKAMSGTFTLALDPASLSFQVTVSTLTSTALIGSTNLASFVLPARNYTLLNL